MVWVTEEKTPRVNNPKLIARAANRDIITLLINILRTGITDGKLAILWWTIDHREEHDVAFITLKLCCVPTKQPVPGEFIR